MGFPAVVAGIVPEKLRHGHSENRVEASGTHTRWNLRLRLRPWRGAFYPEVLDALVPPVHFGESGLRSPAYRLATTR
jgi:hypothetical protein